VNNIYVGVTADSNNVRSIRVPQSHPGPVVFIVNLGGGIRERVTVYPGYYLFFPQSASVTRVGTPPLVIGSTLDFDSVPIVSDVRPTDYVPVFSNENGNQYVGRATVDSLAQYVSSRQGAQGPQGIQGQGFQGAQGSPGTQGPQGPAGSQGAQGAAGNQGLQGTTGSQGVQGATGSQGNQGFQGLTGTQGTQGVPGVQGTTGSQGAQGFQGTQGTQGTQGAAGNQGFQGLPGAQGNSGSQGPQGSQGSQGVQGATGSQGNQGFQGSTGSQGSQGASGTPTASEISDATTVGRNLLTLTNPSAVGFPRIDTGNTVTFRTSAEVRDDLGYVSLTTLATTGSVVINCSTTVGAILSLTGNVTLSTTNDVNGTRLAIWIRGQSSGFTITWWSGIKWPGGVAPTLPTVTGRIITVVLIRVTSGEWDGSYSAEKY